MTKPYEPTFHREEYERVPADDAEQGSHHKYFRLGKKLVWLSVGGFTLYRSDMLNHVINWRTDLQIGPFYFLLAAVAIIVLCMGHLLLVVRPQHGPMALRRWRTFAPKTVQLLTGANLVAFVAAVKTFYPIYGKWTIPMVFLLSWSWLNLLTFL